MSRPQIVGLGGSGRPQSSSDVALRLALQSCAEAGCDTTLLTAADIALPLYDPNRAKDTTAGDALLAAVRGADGLIISSPGYHGGISGLIKNAIDWLEELAQDPRPYLDGVPVGCISVASGSQTSVATLLSLRTVVHTLRGFPTPFGVAVTAVPGLFQLGECADPGVRTQLATLGRQVADYSSRTAARRPARAAYP
ncbi:MAG: NADPH-dependent FMN reductase [Frankia sp.]